MRYFLPKLLAVFTGPRYIPEIKWSSELWTHNVFRVFEAIFGRKVGIRAGSSVSYNSVTGKTIVHIHSFEDAVAQVEVMIRSFFKEKFALPVRVWTMQTAGATPSPFGFPYMLAIAFDAAAGFGSSGGTPNPGVQWNHTCTGSNLTIVAGYGKNGSSENITNRSYNSVAMTVGDTQTNTTSQFQIAYLTNPDTGTHLVEAGTVHNSEWACNSVSMTGTNQTPSSPGSGGGKATSTAISVSVTTTADNSWVVAGGWCTNASFGTSVTGTNQTSRNTSQDTDSSFSGGISTQTTTTAGSYTSGWTISNALWLAGGVEVQPVSVSSVNSNFFTFFR